MGESYDSMLKKTMIKINFTLLLVKNETYRCFIQHLRKSILFFSKVLLTLDNNFYDNKP